ncbi:F-box protein [Rhynchospora pubera]|uniref:F-box protein n=1 Tax=Rhynchospora pubera TaxID=906938 RepID=A0AAV8EJC0_9POAL|nr:F-box protein [Rhynchospora pubera]
MHGELAICTSRVLRKKGILARRERLRVQLKKTLARKFAKWITSMREDKMKKEIDGKSTLKSKGDLTLLHEDCFAHVISFTSPRNACILSLVSSSFRAGVDSDATWKHFLPSDYASLLSRAVHPVQYASLKDLFLQLCDRPVLIDGGKLSFGLNKSTGAKCFTIPAYEMDLPEYKDSTNIDWELVSRVLSPPDKERTMSYYANHTDWEFVSLSNSRFHKGVKLTAHLHVGHNALSGRIESKLLSSHTTYASYLIYRDNNHNDVK